MRQYGKAFPALHQAYEWALCGEYELAKRHLRLVTDELKEYRGASRQERAQWRFSERFFTDYRKDVDRGVWGAPPFLKVRDESPLASGSSWYSTVEEDG